MYVVLARERPKNPPSVVPIVLSASDFSTYFPYSTATYNQAEAQFWRAREG